MRSDSQLWVVNGRTVGTFNTKGFRGHVYQVAAQHLALQLPGRASLRYENEDLVIQLYFEEKKEALQFSYAVDEMRYSRFTGQTKVNLEDPVPVALRPLGLTYVKLAHYRGDDETSPPWSLDNYSFNTGTMVTYRDEMLNQAVDQLRPGLRAVRMHLKDRALFEDVKDKEYNILYGSRDFHDYFDGMLTSDGNVIVNMPLVAINKDDSEPVNSVGTPAARLFRVYVRIECRPAVASAVGTMLKHGSVSVGGNSFRSHVDVCEPDKFVECLEWKYRRTMGLWSTADEPARPVAASSSDPPTTPQNPTRTSKRIAQRNQPTGL